MKRDIVWEQRYEGDHHDYETSRMTMSHLMIIHVPGLKSDIVCEQ